LYAGGLFTTAGAVAAGYVARWNGTRGWTNLDSGASSWVRALAHDGTNLYAGGLFTTAGAVTVNNMARWESTVILHSSVTPASGSSAGGYLVFIGGANLGNGSDITNVTLCGISAAVQSQSATQIVVTAGAAASAGGGDVHVYSTSYGETMKSNAYTYLAVDQPWNARVQSGDRFGVFSNRFGFTIAGASNLVVVVEGCTNLVHPVWVPLETNTLAQGLYYFSDPAWSNYPARFYRVRML
jgi:hypothetical protein